MARSLALEVGIVGALLLLQSACSRCDTSGYFTFTNGSGEEETVLSGSHTRHPLPFPGLRGYASCWLGHAAAWPQLTWQKPGLWIPKAWPTCRQECWEPGVPMGC